jgi:hypothetical protein
VKAKPGPSPPLSYHHEQPEDFVVNVQCDAQTGIVRNNIAKPLLPELPARRPDAPRQFAFANGYRLRSILEESSWAEIDILLTDHPSAVHSPDAIVIIGAKASL